MIKIINNRINLILILNIVSRINIVFYLIFLALISIFFLPPINIMGLRIRLDDIIVLLFVPILIIHFKYIKFENYIYFILLFLFSVFISIVYGYLIMDVEYNSGDLNEFVRYFKIFLFSVALGYTSVDKLSRITIKIFYYGSFYIILVAYLQYFDLFGIGKYLTLLYTSESQLFTAIEHQIRRITITGSGPNDGAIIVSYFILFNFFSFLFTNNKKYLLLFIVLFSTLLFTQSRTLLVATIFSLIFVFFTIKGYIFKKIFLFIILVVLMIILFPLFTYIFTGFEAFFKGEDNSVLLRFNNAIIAYEAFLNSPIVGYGIGKSFFENITMDSEWLSIISRFGLFGIFTSIILLIYPFSLKKIVKKINNVQLNIFYYTLISSSIMGCLTMLTNNFITGYQSFLEYILLMILTVRLIKFNLKGIK